MSDFASMTIFMVLSPGIDSGTKLVAVVAINHVVRVNSESYTRN